MRSGRNAIQVECIWNGKAALAESPLWVVSEQVLYWVDIEQARLYRYQPASRSIRCRQLEGRLTSIAPGQPGQFVGTFADGFVSMDRTGNKVTRIVAPERNLPDNRFNDGKLDPRGRFWAGTMNEQGAGPTGALYRLDADLRCRKMDDGYTISNGPAFSPDGRRMYCADSAIRTVFRMELDAEGNIEGKSLFIEFTEAMGLPDGMTVDCEGNLWICHWGGWRVSCFAGDGRLLGAIRLPVSNVTSCCFGGSDLSVLYITSARQGLRDKALRKQPLAGGVFSCEPGVRGLPSPNFPG